ncbi:hypothetical protein [Shewanella holmiensis]|uniref:PepSY domain-containing protein n=1 Tax=Shewanella holmiensis TaxID=2952222 RepID=A0A9X2WPM8_9GAMM|nr:hypothetical protein [Shewanella holmiensis]MCT7943228.1 hypothetical protein [Shewanella holmiensis]
MVRLLVALCLFPLVSMAAPSIQSLVSQEGLLTPISVMEHWEQQEQGTLCGFGLEIDNEQLVYLLSAINTESKRLYQFEYSALDGALLDETSQPYEGNSILHAVSLMREKNISFSSLVSLAIQNQNGFLLQADLDHDLSISYLELQMLSNEAKKVIAFDIENLRPLPLLKWD